ncbi:unnamed protein product [Onchocerca flexuosa]|uniref:Uncharacterized protein n=1 Tax=Onchocerca flexuosa TaxID=387005 RepID=A0A183H9S8_9BILA|nr:unnamed protein product [Onchocerca flexuosa]
MISEDIANLGMNHLIERFHHLTSIETILGEVTFHFGRTSMVQLKEASKQKRRELESVLLWSPQHIMYMLLLSFPSYKYC